MLATYAKILVAGSTVFLTIRAMQFKKRYWDNVSMDGHQYIWVISCPKYRLAIGYWRNNTAIARKCQNAHRER